IRDRSDIIDVVISERLLADHKFVNRLMQGGRVEMVGLAGQSDTDPPFDSGYRLIPRDSNDFSFAPVPPYSAIAISTLVAGLLAISAYLWFQRRNAERNARALASLTETLRDSQEALRDSEERFRRVFEDGPVGIVIGSPDLKILQVNRALCRILGYQERELVGLSFLDITHPEDAQRSLDQARKLFEGETRGYQLEKRYITKSREVIWVKVTVSLVRDSAGKPQYALGVVEDITERKQSEAAIALSEKRFRALIERSSDCIWLVNPAGEVLYDAEPATLRNLGYTKNEIVGRNALELVHPDDLDRMRGLLADLIPNAGACFTAQYRQQHKDGSWHWMEGTATNLLGESSVGAIVINARDITERKRAEEKLRQSEERFSRAFHASPVAISIATFKEGRFIDVNESFLGLLGYSREELVGRTALELGIWVKQTDRIPIMEQLQEKGSVRDIESHFRTRSGEIRESLASAELIKLNGEPCILCLVHDITQRKQAEEALRKSEERFQLIAHATNDTVWDWDLKTDEVWWNEGIKTVFGYSLEEVGHDGSWWDDHIHAEDKDRVLAGMHEVVQSGGRYWSSEYRYRRADGSYADVFDRGYVLLDDYGRPIRMIGAMMDITVRKRVERELAKARDEALESVRLKSEFLANISHEVRTPLNGIIGMTVLLQDSSLTPEQRSFSETIQASADALLGIINDILDFSKLEAGKLQFETLDFDLRALVESTLELLAERAQQKHVELVSLIDSNVPILLRGDPGRLRQVITNLVVNAIKFTDHGDVVLRVARESETTTDASLCFTVIDTGIGIPHDAVPHLFQAFYQADGSTTRKYGGTGLGLAISKQLVEMMGGQIGVESTAGKGSTFWFTVKLVKQANTAVSGEDRKARFAGLRVLIVDDNETNRGILLHQTAALAMRPDSAAGGEEALQKLRTAAAADDRYAVAILDMQMSSMDGLTLARSIKADPTIASTRLLLMTSLGPRSDTAALRAAGIGAFLVKPVKQSQLIDCLAALTTPSPQHETRFWLNRKDSSDASDKRPRSSKPVHILVAEDNPINQKVAIGLLDKLGYRAEAVANGPEVMRATELVSYDIIFMDCQLPEMDGYKTTSEIRRREAARHNNRKRTYIIAMTAHAMRGAREKCLEAGMDDYISKPVHLETLRTVLDKAVHEVQSPKPVAAKPDTKGTDVMIDQSALITLRTLRQPGKPDPVSELIDIFLRDTPGRLSEMKTAVEQYDAYSLELVAHSLRGCSSSVGACRMAEICSQLEEHARLGSIQIASHVLKQLDQEFNNVRAALELEKLA
ncbi:MAG TPA: PAS domain S-box protein, partial [Verrucomicrobiae bacterium]|nr:PAS domain S-box protein [Verrucomicrobiae bacterium]